MRKYVRNFNETSFTPEEVDRGAHLDLIKYLLSYNEKAEGRYNDIHITSDGYCTIVQWVDRSFEYEGGQFTFVDEDELVMKECILPDNSIVMCYDDDECEERLNEFLEDNPTYKQNEWGRWYDERDVVTLDQIKDTSDEVIESISKGVLND